MNYKNERDKIILQKFIYEYLDTNYSDFTEHVDVEIDLAVNMISNVLSHLLDKEEVLQDVIGLIREKIADVNS